jgi:membrane protease YdiL (CAAX protease family)
MLAQAKGATQMEPDRPETTEEPPLEFQQAALPFPLGVLLLVLGATAAGAVALAVAPLLTGLALRLAPPAPRTVSPLADGYVPPRAEIDLPCTRPQSVPVAIEALRAEARLRPYRFEPGSDADLVFVQPVPTDEDLRLVKQTLDGLVAFCYRIETNRSGDGLEIRRMGTTAGQVNVALQELQAVGGSLRPSPGQPEQGYRPGGRPYIYVEPVLEQHAALLSAAVDRAGIQRHRLTFSRNWRQASRADTNAPGLCGAQPDRRRAALDTAATWTAYVILLLGIGVVLRRRLLLSSAEDQSQLHLAIQVGIGLALGLGLGLLVRNLAAWNGFRPLLAGTRVEDLGPSRDFLALTLDAMREGWGQAGATWLGVLTGVLVPMVEAAFLFGCALPYLQRGQHWLLCAIAVGVLWGVNPTHVLAFQGPVARPPLMGLAGGVVAGLAIALTMVRVRGWVAGALAGAAFAAMLALPAVDNARVLAQDEREVVAACFRSWREAETAAALSPGRGAAAAAALPGAATPVAPAVPLPLAITE